MYEASFKKAFLQKTTSIWEILPEEKNICSKETVATISGVEKIYLFHIQILLEQ